MPAHRRRMASSKRSSPTRAITAIRRWSISKRSACARYIAEPDRGRRELEEEARGARRASIANRRRIRGARGMRLLRQRGERLERPFAHLYETGGMRRTHLRGHANILKRLLVHAGGFNLGLLMRHADRRRARRAASRGGCGAVGPLRHSFGRSRLVTRLLTPVADHVAPSRDCIARASFRARLSRETLLSPRWYGLLPVPMRHDGRIS